MNEDKNYPPLTIEGKFLWSGQVEYVSVSVKSLKKAGWTDEMVDTLIELIKVGIDD